MASTNPKLSPRVPSLGYSDAFAKFLSELSFSRKKRAEDAIKILQKSESYQNTVKDLNKKYLSAIDLHRLGKLSEYEPDEDGKLTKGEFAGRRTLVFSDSTEGNRFVRAGSHQTRSTGLNSTDWIFLDLEIDSMTSPDEQGSVVAQLAETIAHETVHAHRRVNEVKIPDPASRIASVDAFLNDEIATRKGEKTILNEILKAKEGKENALEIFEKTINDKGLRKEFEKHVGAMKLSRPEVERDFVSGSRLTYLEKFVIEGLIEMSIKKGGLSDETIEESKELVNRLDFDHSIEVVAQISHPEWRTSDPKSGLKTAYLPNQFAELFLVRRVMAAHWEEPSTADREAVLQAHRNTFFPKEIAYTPLPESASGLLGGLSKQTSASPGETGALFSSRILREDMGLVLVPAPASQPTPGTFYQIKSGDSLFGISKKAYGADSLKTARRINDSQYNHRFWKAAPATEQQMFPDGRISFTPRFTSDVRAQMESVDTVPAGKSFAMIWIPGQDGAEPF